MSDDFYADLSPVERFLDLAEIERYHPVPEDSMLFVGDVVSSTPAIEAGHYKEVNVAAAAIIAAVGNALPGRSIAFSFAGDGASFVLPARLETVGRQALGATVRWAKEALGLDLRAAAVPVAAIRAAGLDLKLARFAVTADLSYAMFAGGGLAWAEARMKEGRFPVAPPDAAVGPDLSGLSCSFASIPARHGVILSLIVVPATRERLPEFAALVAEILALAQERDGDVRPLREGGLRLGWALRTLLIEAKTAAAKPKGRGVSAFLATGWTSLLKNFTLRTGRRIGGFDPERYLGEIVRNTDFRKFDDGLRMTLDCSPATADAIEARLGKARRDGLAAFGTHRQDEAMLTCFVPSPLSRDHVHFIDGASGGYAYAARALKEQLRG
ncbi:hypothetical protein GCM10011390_51000 [Aureimonas endophytica]|uniref:DUF3095 family protein n=1 Tax=Aureimonas endophytica TaxID=2027858 RepID=A0A917A4Y3_9HYPH|nr:DUF3095 domain-containing protein [Aureimonas endophytica]GGE25344.1 hypothetical protein GCM10011390_51000 [Aureimonas endophytica]